MRISESFLALILLYAPLTAAMSVGVPVPRLAEGADAIVVVRILDDGTSFIDENGTPATRWLGRVLRSDGGVLTRDSLIPIIERGGEVAGRGLLVAGVPEYRRGETVLLFLVRRPDGAWRAYQHEQGVFRPDARGWMRGGGSLSRLDSLALDSLEAASWLLTGQEGNVTAPVRHLRFDLRERLTVSVSGSSARFPEARRYVDLAMKAWNDDPASHVYLLRGADTSAGYAVEDGVSAIVLDATIPDADSSVVGQTSIFYSATVTGEGEPFFEIEEADVAVRGGLLVSAKVYAEILTHELGHALGFRHSNEGTPQSADAVMNSGISGRFGPSLGPWDREALAAVYPQLIPACTSPVIAITGHEGLHANGSSVELRAIVTLDAVDSIEWYRGASGNTTHPLGRGSVVMLGNVTESFAFWVRATGTCGFTDTPAYEVLVEFCDPANLVDLQYPAVVAQGTSASVRAVVGGETPLKIEWFDADPASGAAPVAEGETFVTPLLSAPTEFWVRPSNRCGESAVRAFTIDVARASRRRGVRPPGQPAGAASEITTRTSRSLPVYQRSPSHSSPLIDLTAVQ